MGSGSRGTMVAGNIYFEDFPVLYVDDEELHLLVFRETFGDDFHVLCASSADDAMRLLEEQPVAVLLVDQRMPGMTGIELCERVRERHPSVQRLLVTAYSDHKTAIEAINRGGASRYLAKPWDADEVRQALREAVARAHLERRVQALTTALIDRERSATLAASRARILHDLGNMGQHVSIAADSLAQLVDTLREALPAAAFEEAHGAIVKLQSVARHMLRLQRRTARTTGGDAPSRGHLRVAEVVETAVELLRGEIAGVARVTIDCPEDLSVWADRTDLSRILLNLLRNALQAFEAAGRNRGKITIAATAKDGTTAIEVADDGPGIPNELLARVVEPGFTTRRDSGGSGLGLAICRELAIANDGTLELVPIDLAAEGWEPGARFRILLPTDTPEEASAQVA